MEETKNEVAAFEQANIIVFETLHDLKAKKEAIEQEEKELKQYIQEAMEQFGIKSFKNDFVTLSYVNASSSTSIDLKMMENKEPELYKELLADYPKVTNKKAYVKITVK